MSVPVLSRLFSDCRRRTRRLSDGETSCTLPRPSSTRSDSGRPEPASSPVRLRAHTASRSSPTDPALRANPSPEVTDPVCRLPLPTLFHSTRGCSPRRPAAVMGTTGCESTVQPALPRIFKGRRERTGRHLKCGAMPDVETLSPANPIPGEASVEKKRQLFPGLPPASPSSVALPPPAEADSALPFGNVNPIPFRGPAPTPNLPAQGRNREPKRDGCPLGRMGEVTPSLRIDSPVSNCCSHGTLLHFGLQGPPLNTCYYHQDPHRRPLHLRSSSRLHRHTQNGDLRALLLPGAHTVHDCPAGVGKLGATLQRHPFSGLVDSAGELLHTP